AHVSRTHSGVSPSHTPTSRPEHTTHSLDVPHTGCSSSHASVLSLVHSMHMFAKQAGVWPSHTPALSSVHATHVPSKHAGIVGSNAMHAASGSVASLQGTHSP